MGIFSIHLGIWLGSCWAPGKVFREPGEGGDTICLGGRGPKRRMNALVYKADKGGGGKSGCGKGGLGTSFITPQPGSMVCLSLRGSPKGCTWEGGESRPGAQSPLCLSQLWDPEWQMSLEGNHRPFFGSWGGPCAMC